MCMIIMSVVSVIIAIFNVTLFVRNVIVAVSCVIRSSVLET